MNGPAVGVQPWTRRVARLSGGMAHGITFVMRERTGHNVRAEAAVNARKVHVDGTVSLTLALDQTKYGDELIAQLYTRTRPTVADRRADGWSRVQIYLGPLSEETATMLESIATEIRARMRQQDVAV